MKNQFFYLQKCQPVSFRNLKIILLGIFFLQFCLQGMAQKKPNIIYILTDQWSTTAFGYAGNKQVKTPNIDKFAGDAVNFKNCVSVIPKCTPHRAALLTGRFPTTTGMFMNDLFLPDSELCMAEIFKNAGYSTAYYGKWHLDGHGRLNNVEPARRQGFDYWKALECSHEYNKMPYYDNDDPNLKYWNQYSPFAIEEDVEKYLEKASGDNNPFLLFIALGTPHFSKDPAPEKYQAMYPPGDLKLSPNVIEGKFPGLRKELQGYYAHCTATDEAIGNLINKIKDLGLYDNSIIIFTSDHGEMMGSHGVRPKEKQVAWDESAKVPFLIRYPGIGRNAGKATLTPLNTPDILPTMLSLTNVPIPKTIEGENIADVVKHPIMKKDRAVMFMSMYAVAPTKFSEYRAIKTNRYTYVKSPTEAIMLFDNIRDPYEMNNLVGKVDYANLQNKMDKILQKKLKDIGDTNFKSYRYYLDKFGFEGIGRDGQEIPYSLDPNKIMKVYSPHKK
ncbi:MAG: sulfatase [Ginsengibacter sp.]